jgi:hypothetical protein
VRATDERCFSGAVFIGNHRRDEDAVEFSLLIIDYPHHAPEKIFRLLRDRQLAFAYYTTYSHRQITASNPEVGPRYRFVIPLAEPIPAAVYSYLWDWAFALTDGRIDSSSKELSCAFPMPALKEENAPFEFESSDGDWLDWQTALTDAQASSDGPDEITDQKIVIHRDFPQMEELNSWGALRAELGRRIIAHPSARRNGQGKWSCCALCHGGKGNIGISYDQATNQAYCNHGCDQASVLRAFGLPEQPHSLKKTTTTESTVPRRDFQVLRLADVKTEQVDWLWHPYIPFGKLTILEGDPGLGKSWMTCAIATAVANGFGLPGMKSAEPRNVVLLSAEDGLGDTVRPRLDSMRADLRRIFAVDGALTFDEMGCVMFEEVIIERRAQLVIIDPIVAYIGAEVDLHRANETRAVMARLARIAERHGCAILSLRHLTKGTGGKAIYRGYGSIDITAAARSVLLVGADPDDESKRAIIQTKSNLAPKGMAIGYKLNAEGFFWTGESDLTADRILSSWRSENDDSSSDALSFLRESLAEGERPVKEVTREARDFGITEKMLRRAREKLGIESIKRGGYFGKADGQEKRDGGWFWKLPDLAPEPALADGQGQVQQNVSCNGSYGNSLTDLARSQVRGQVQGKLAEPLNGNGKTPR